MIRAFPATGPSDMRLATAVLSLCLGFAAILASGAVRAHSTQLSSSRLTVSGRDIVATVEMNRRDVDAALAVAATVSSGTGGDPLARYLAGRLHLRNLDGGECGVEIGDRRTKDDHVLVDLRWRCPPVAGRLVVETGLFTDIDPAARHLVTVGGDVSRIGLLTAGSPRLELVTLSPATAEVLVHYFVAGVEHIAIGYDHIAFLVAVILWGRRFWPLAGVVTAFTGAHTVTLALAALDVVQLPGALVEILIALSIVFVAAENFFVTDLRHRWWQAFLFGLVHGFGFASVLREYGLPREARIPALAAFNVGVEVGQLAIVATSLVLFRGVEGAWRRAAHDAAGADVRFVRAVSGLLLVLGAYWAVTRIVAEI